MKADNYINTTLKSIPSNEALSRVIVASFASQADPTLEQIADIKTAVSEAVTNSIVHGYEGKEGEIKLSCRMHGKILTVEIEDFGCGIENVEQARQPLFTTNSEKEVTMKTSAKKWIKFCVSAVIVVITLWLLQCLLLPAVLRFCPRGIFSILPWQSGQIFLHRRA